MRSDTFFRGNKAWHSVENRLRVQRTLVRTTPLASPERLRPPFPGVALLLSELAREEGAVHRQSIQVDLKL